MKRAFIFGLIFAGLTAAVLPAFQSKKEKAEEAQLRSVEGAVRDQSDNPVEGAVVQLKNTKTLQVRSFITKPDGTYYFHGLSRNIDYEAKAEKGGFASDSKTVSSFDDRKKITINLKLDQKKS
jgi:hypothetical protein